MPDPASLPAQSSGVNNQAFSAILDAIVTRIVNGCTGNVGTSVRIVAVPDDQLPQFLAEPGWLIRVNPPTPFTQSGAGRWGYQVQRQVDIFVITSNLSDPGGRDDIAVRAHCDAEEALLNAMLLLPPTDTTYANAVGKICNWIPGGEAITRKMKLDPSLLVSCQSYAITYMLKVNVLRL